MPLISLRIWIFLFLDGASRTNPSTLCQINHTKFKSNIAVSTKNKKINKKKEKGIIFVNSFGFLIIL